jgi:hypothetical protein
MAAVRTSLPEKKLAKALDRVNRAQTRFWHRYPGDSGAYVSSDLSAISPSLRGVSAEKRCAPP